MIESLSKLAAGSMAARGENPKSKGCPAILIIRMLINLRSLSERYNVVKTALLIEGGGKMRTLANAAT
jgi:hypothetical protein